MLKKRQHQVASPLQASLMRRVGRFLFWYTALFALCFVCCYYPFWQEGKSLIWKIDGLPQYLLWQQYTGNYLLDFLRGLLHGEWVAPSYDFNIGMGGNVRAFLRTEPVMVLGVLGRYLPWKWVFEALWVLRVYCIGLSFSVYAKDRGWNFLPILAGAILYAFNGYTLYHIQRHPHFAFAPFMLPLLALGYERVLQRKNVLFFTLMVAVSLIGSYYFTYISTIFLGVYALLRFPYLYKEHRVAEFLKMMGRIIASYLFGVMMALFSFIPSISRFLLSSRSGSSVKAVLGFDSLLYYNAKRWTEVLLGIFEPILSEDYNTALTFSVFLIPALVLLFTRRKKEEWPLRIGVVLVYVGLCVPLVGYVLSGFGAVTNRWGYFFVFLFAMIFTVKAEELCNLRKVDLFAMIAVTAVLAALVFTLHNTRTYRLGLWMLIGAVLLLVVLHVMPKLSRKNAQRILCVAVALSIGVSGWWVNSEMGLNFVEQFADSSVVNSYYTGSRYRYLAAIEDDSFYRTDTDMMFSNYNNTSVALGYNGISLYNSTIGSRTIAYYRESESTGISAQNRTLSLDNRSSQEALASVKYFITEKKSGKANVPYGFELDPSLTANSKTYDIYVNQNQLPIGYAYQTVIPRSVYETLSALEKQEVMLTAAVVDDEDLQALNLSETTKCPTEITKGTVTLSNPGEGITLRGSGLTYQKPEGSAATKEAATVQFSTTAKANCEVYLRYCGTVSKKTRADIYATTDRTSKRAIVRPETDTYTLRMENYLLNLGVYEQDEDLTGSITIDMGSQVEIDSIEVYYLPLDGYDAAIDALSAESLQQVTLGNDVISGTITTQGDRLLTFSVPYEIGWSATVDGEPVELIPVNTMYMGLALEEGTHEITLRYAVPGMNIGVDISIAATLLFLALVLLCWKRRNTRS